jgi:hypothetical protein
MLQRIPLNRLRPIKPIKQQSQLPNPITNFIRISAASTGSLYDITNSMRERESGIYSRSAQPGWRGDNV